MNMQEEHRTGPERREWTPVITVLSTDPSLSKMVLVIIVLVNYFTNSKIQILLTKLPKIEFLTKPDEPTEKTPNVHY